MEIEFYAQIGDVSTDIPWKRPTLVSFSKWWEKFSKVEGLEDFEVHLCGSFCEKLFGVYNSFPNDCDIVLTNPINDYKKLKFIMDSAVQIGFDNQILIDVTWYSDLYAHQRTPFKPYGYIRNGKTFIKTMGKRVEQINFNADEVQTLPNGLTHYTWYKPSHTYKKVQQRKDLGVYVGTMVNCREMFD